MVKIHAYYAPRYLYDQLFVSRGFNQLWGVYATERTKDMWGHEEHIILGDIKLHAGDARGYTGAG